MRNDGPPVGSTWLHRFEVRLAVVISVLPVLNGLRIRGAGCSGTLSDLFKPILRLFSAPDVLECWLVSRLVVCTLAC